MLKRTHLAIGFAVALYFLPFVNNTISFIPIVLIASIFPNLDSLGFSLGKERLYKPFQALAEHRGFFHNYTLAVLFSLGLTLFYPVFGLPFFLGYSFHLLADSFTVRGIRPFWPLKVKSSGRVRNGGKIDKGIFYSFVLLDVLLIIVVLLNGI